METFIGLPDPRPTTPPRSIRYVCGQCSLGLLLVAATERGVCAIALGEDADQLTRDLQIRFAQAELSGGGDELEQWLAVVIGFVDAAQPSLKLPLELPLDLHGTPFQQRVWRALREIPPGSTTTYTELARRLDQPTAVRAVAKACAANPLAIAIPCHRVLRIDGDLAGYRWGIERKRELLRRETDRVDATRPAR